MVRPKGNYNMEPPALVFELEGAQVKGKDDEVIDISRVTHTYEEQLDKTRVLGGMEPGDGERKREREEAMDIIWSSSGRHQRGAGEGHT